MSMNKLIEKIAAMQNPSVAGLDPKLDYVPNTSVRRLSPPLMTPWRQPLRRFLLLTRD